MFLGMMKSAIVDIFRRDEEEVCGWEERRASDFDWAGLRSDKKSVGQVRVGIVPYKLIYSVTNGFIWVVYGFICRCGTLAYTTLTWKFR